MWYNWNYKPNSENNKIATRRKHGLRKWFCLQKKINGDICVKNEELHEPGPCGTGWRGGRGNSSTSTRTTPGRLRGEILGQREGMLDFWRRMDQIVRMQSNALTRLNHIFVRLSVQTSTFWLTTGRTVIVGHQYDLTFK